MLDREKDRMCIDIARLYYESNYSQQEIAHLRQISRPTVSKLLQRAKDLGYVNIHIYDPLEEMDDLSDKIQKMYHLDSVRIAYSPLNKNEEIRKHIGRVAAEFLNQTMKNGDIIGVTWGRTLHSVSSQLKKSHAQGIEVVQLKGGVTHSRLKNYSFEIVQDFADAFNTIARYLPLPVIFDSPEVKQMVEQDRNIKQILELGKQANIVVFTVGTVRDDSLLFNLGYLSQDEKEALSRSAVGDICSRFFDRYGKICNERINERTVGIELDDLSTKEKSILVAGGKRKLMAMHTALTAGYANILITDQFTGRSLLEMQAAEHNRNSQKH
ncbi:sugar-binding transcriptional regulator [Sporolactobacillus kofuensis]|uniref:Sugar-binding transcriptional regulator n=1 Tax=Sporolactobacillus kofuensis TaxID=269672 RepID=A0ABW1WCU1_9BACL|nr:sugar-binding transcriptional regulator [Sporolactobacillus kofuensis]MCO7174831.1 sugar-binding transcriptional regulator [Sporolactobacillus kofuensis]